MLIISWQPFCTGGWDRCSPCCSMGNTCRSFSLISALVRRRPEILSVCSGGCWWDWVEVWVFIYPQYPYEHHPQSPSQHGEGSSGDRCHTNIKALHLYLTERFKQLTHLNPAQLVQLLHSDVSVKCVHFAVAKGRPTKKKTSQILWRFEPIVFYFNWTVNQFWILSAPASCCRVVFTPDEKPYPSTHASCSRPPSQVD